MSKRSNKKIIEQQEDAEEDDDVNQFHNTQCSFKKTACKNNLSIEITSSNNTVNACNSQVNEISNTDSELPIEITVKDLFKLAKKDEFPHKVFLFNENRVYVTPVSQFFTTETRVYSKKPDVKIGFKCKICSRILNCKFGELTNLNHHLFTHPDSRDWYKQFQQHRGNKNANVLTEGQLNLIKLFVSSYQSLSMLKK